jgi:hypothetical protein
LCWSERRIWRFIGGVCFKKQEHLGGVETTQAEHVMGLLSGDDCLAFGKALQRETPVPGVAFFVERCVDCWESNPVLTFKAAKHTSKGKVEHKELGQQPITPSQNAQIVEGMLAQS